MPKPTKRPKLATELRQLALIEAAIRLAAQRSPADITTAELARVVGLTQGAIFKHFSSKEAIWLAVLEWATTNLMERLRAATRSAESEGAAPAPLRALQYVFQAHVEFVIQHPGVPRVIFQELQHGHETALKASVRSLMAQHRGLVEALLVQAKEQGTLAAQTSPTSAAVLLLGCVQGLVMQGLISGDVRTIAMHAPGVFAMFLRGITLKEHP